MSVTSELDTLIEQLDEALQRERPTNKTIGQPTNITHAGATDALDLILDSPPRRTQVRRLRDSQVVLQFREDLAGGLVRMDRLSQLLKLLSLVANRLIV